MDPAAADLDGAPTTPSTTRPHVAFVLEQALGHITYSDNLRRHLVSHADLDATILPIRFDMGRWGARIPIYRNWTVRAGLRAQAALRRVRRERPIDAVFANTQVPAVLMLLDIVHRTPTVISLDATPVQLDELGEHYQHRIGSALSERIKISLYRHSFRRAHHLTVWSEWARASLIDDYDVPAHKITVIPPGADLARWRRDEPHADDAGPIRILFVGGDLVRKGGDDLITAFGILRAHRPDVDLRLDIVTRERFDAGDGVVVHTGVTPNSDELVTLFHDADVFCLPAVGDCLPMVLSEAAAAGLPLVSTTVGAIPEIAVDGETGFVIEPHDVDALVERLERLVDDAELRRSLGRRAADLAAERYDAAANADRIARLVVAAAAGARS